MRAWSTARTSRVPGTSPAEKKKRRTDLPRLSATILLALLLPLTASSVRASGRIPGDLDDSGVVDFPDFLIFAGIFNQTSADAGFNPRADLNSDLLVNFIDFLLLVDVYGTVAPDVGNDPGNGDEIVHGPDAPSGGDRDNPFRSLTVHPSNADVLLLGTERNGFVRSIDGGQTWTRHRLGLRHQGDLYPEIWDIAYDPRDPTIVYAATLDSPGPVTGDYPSSSAGVYKSVDGGDTWARKNCGLSSSRITSIDVLGGDSSVVVLGVEGGTASFSELQGVFFGGGLYRSADGGDTWDRAATAVDDSTNGYWHLVVRQDSVFTFGHNLNDPERNGGFLRSVDGGSSWEAFGEEIRPQLVTHFAVSDGGRTIIGNARDSFRLLISADGGDTWRDTDINQASGPVAISPIDTNLILFTAGQTTIRRSTDGLETSTDVFSAEGTVSEIVFAPPDPTIVYVITEGSTLYRSEDSGASFERIVNIRTDVLNP